MKNPDPGHVKRPDGAPAIGGEDTILVYPRCLHVTFPPKGGQYRDVINIQWAIDNVAENGAVRLMTTDPDDNELKAFYFGEPGPGAGYLEIKKNVNIIGEKLLNAPLASNGNVEQHVEWDVNGTYNQEFQLPGGRKIISDRATIYGGGRPSPEAESGTFHFVINTLPSASYGFSLSQVRFDISGLGACVAQSCGPKGITLTDNVVTNVKPLRGEPFQGDTAYFAKGFGAGFKTKFMGINGPIIINNNYIDIWGPDIESPNPTYTASQGILVGFTSNVVTANIKQNTINNPGVEGISCTAAASAEMWIEENIVNVRKAEVEDERLPWGFGIDVGRYAEIPISDPNYPFSLPPRAHVLRNKLNYSASHGAIRMSFGKPGGTVKENNIYLGAHKDGEYYAAAGIGLLGPCNEMTISSNKISGTATGIFPTGSYIWYGSGIQLAHANPRAKGPYNNTINIYPGDMEELVVHERGGHVRMMFNTSNNVVNLHNTPHHGIVITDDTVNNYPEQTDPPELYIRNLWVPNPPNPIPGAEDNEIYNDEKPPSP